jgi:hypothetical protein
MEYRGTRFWMAVLALVVTAASLAEAQVYYRRDPKERPAELDVAGRLYKPAGQVRLWEFRLHGFLSERVTYDDNIFLNPYHGDTEEDFISQTALGLRVDLPPGRHEILAGYQARIVEFFKSNEHDTIEHQAFFKGSLNFDAFFLDVWDDLEKESDPTDLVYSDRVDRWKNTLGVRTGLIVQRLFVEASYQNRWFEFRSPFTSLSRVENYFHLTAHVMLREEAKILQQFFGFLELEFGHFRFRTDANNDSNYTALWLGAKGTLYEELPFLLKVGYLKQIAASDGANPDEKDYEGPVWEAKLSYRLDLLYTFALTCYRRVEVSGSSNYRVYDRGEFSFEMQFPPKITDRLYAGLHLFFDTAAPSNSRAYSRWGGGVKIEYAFQDWAFFGLSYEYRYRWTQIPDADYRQNQVSIHATFVY